MRSASGVTVIAVAWGSLLLGGCALVANYDFDKYRERPDTGAGGTGAGGEAGAGGSPTTSSTGVGGAGSASSSSGAGGASSSSSSSAGGASSSSSGGAGGAGGAGGGEGGATLTVLYDGPLLPTSIAIDATSVFWTASAGFMSSGGEIRRVEKDNTNPATLAMDLASSPGSIALDASTVYWISSGDSTTSILRVPRAGGALSTVLTLPEGILGISAAGGQIYYTTSTTDSISRVPAGGGVPTPLVTGQNRVADIVVDGPSIYWTTLGRVSMGDGSIASAQLDGSAVQVLASSQEFPLSLEARGTRVYWTTLNAGLRSVGKDGADLFTSVTPGSGMPPCSDLAVDETAIYYTQDHAVRRVPIGSTASSVVMRLPDDPKNLVLDATSLYVTTSDGGGGRVLKIRK